MQRLDLDHVNEILCNVKCSNPKCKGTKLYVMNERSGLATVECADPTMRKNCMFRLVTVLPKHLSFTARLKRMLKRFIDKLCN